MAENPDVKITQSGFGSFEAGQVMKGMRLGTEVNHVWIQKMYLQLSTEAIVKERMRIMISAEGQMWFSYPQLQAYAQTQQPQFNFYFKEVDGAYSFGELQCPILQFGVGYFPFKYNPDARNLGEYLFDRAGNYSQYITTSFDFPFSRLLGLRLTNRLFHGALRQDLLLASETGMFPLMDYSGAYVISGSLFKTIDLGAGINFSRYLSINKENTDKQNDPVSLYIKENGDTAYYSFQGIKAMGRASIDCKTLLPSDRVQRMMGTDEFRIYGEAGVLGLIDIVNYGKTTRDTTFLDPLGNLVTRTDTFPATSFYDSLWQRIPVMFGISMPTFKVLDVLSLEFEWWGTRFANNYKAIVDDNRPIPYFNFASKSNPWKWSLYAKKTLAPGFSLTAQVARDHMRIQTADAKQQDKEEALQTKSHWWWMLKFMFGF